MWKILSYLGAAAGGWFVGKVIEGITEDSSTDVSSLYPTEEIPLIYPEFTKEQKSNLHPRNIKLVQTCEICPEQYDAYIGKQKVGYLRLRNGHFTVNYPDCGGDLVYETLLNDMVGCFDDEKQRKQYIREAKKALIEKIKKSK